MICFDPEFQRSLWQGAAFIATFSCSPPFVFQTVNKTQTGSDVLDVTSVPLEPSGCEPKPLSYSRKHIAEIHC